MAKSWVKCFWCGKNFLKDNRYINWNKKSGDKFYCSIRCQSFFKNKQLKLLCENPACNREFRKKRCEVSRNNYCSRSCAVAVNNVKFPKKIATIRKCVYCNKILSVYRKYCSIRCKSDALTINKESVIDRIRRFHKEYGRIPLKREMWGIYKPSRKYFGTWNNAIEAAGFNSNPIMFAKHQIANDGHICDSIAEKIIDDYLFEKGIAHERSVSYPEGDYSADFKIGSMWIEYLGLAGEHKRYDELRLIKQKIAKRYKLKLLEIYPKDIYPHNKLGKILGIEV